MFIQIIIITVINFDLFNYDELYDYYYIFYFCAVMSCSPAHPKNSLDQYFAPHGSNWLCHSHYCVSSHNIFAFNVDRQIACGCKHIMSHPVRTRCQRFQMWWLGLNQEACGERNRIQFSYRELTKVIV